MLSWSWGWRPAAAIALPLAVGAIGGIVTSGAIPTWYRTLVKPSWNPPDEVFGPVWILLYVAMGIALAVVLRAEGGQRRRAAVLAFAIQLSLNLAWTLVFFGLREVGLAAVIIAALWVAIVATMDAFSRISLAAGLLILPYLGWVSFASVLNAAVWRLNAG
ncbi:MAG TPA: TspO/MBR family protein [Candidatus Limnocylindrales bacterium]|jgi:tryptophan-rich sensory protein